CLGGWSPRDRIERKAAQEGSDDRPGHPSANIPAGTCGTRSKKERQRNGRSDGNGCAEKQGRY
ncbi:MAG: hypothetical protein ACODAD_15810, partial [Planctomycetota bacterium]